MPFCENCGALLSEGKKFCTKCGRPIEGLFDEVGAGSVKRAPPAPTVPPRPQNGIVVNEIRPPLSAPAGNTKSCPFCGEDILDVAIKCKHCGADLTDREVVKGSEGIGLANLLVPLCAAFIAWFWIPNTNDPTPKMYGLATITVLLTAILMAVEANSVGAGNDQDRNPNGKKREGPILWFAWGVVLWVVGYPMWMARRAKYGLRNLCAPSILVALVFLGVIAAVSLNGGVKVSTADLQGQVLQSIQEKFAENPQLAGVRINSFHLVHEEGNEYKGVLQIEENGSTATDIVDVTYDGKQFMWRIRP